MKFDVPDPADFVDADGSLTRESVAFITKVRNGIVWRSQAGTTAQRPTTGVEVGTPYFDTTLGKQINAKTVPGSGGAITWVDGAGVVV